MAEGPVTRITVRRPNGRTEIIGRAGVMSLEDAEKMVSGGGMGVLLSVRHEQVQGGKRTTLGIHPASGI